MKKIISFVSDYIATISISIMLIVIICIPIGLSELKKERSASFYHFRWTGKKWEITPKDIDGVTIKSPYGFLHGYVTRGRSHTLVVPHSLLGDEEVRVHFWDEKP